MTPKYRGSVYIANHDWAVIPDFKEPEDFHATERVWYVGARENVGSTFISPPYAAKAGDIDYIRTNHASVL